MLTTAFVLTVDSACECLSVCPSAPRCFFLFLCFAAQKNPADFFVGTPSFPLKKVGGGDVFWRFSFFRAKKRAPGQPSPTKKTRGKQTSLLSIFPGF